MRDAEHSDWVMLTHLATEDCPVEIKSPRLHFSGATGTHVGDRESQQDRVLLLRHPGRNDCLLGLVADGMGGHSGGRLAADQVCLTAQIALEDFDPQAQNATDWCHQMALAAHFELHRLAAETGLQPHSTLAAFLVLPDGQCHWIHSGDSRLYHFRDGVLVRMSSDHSHVQYLVEQQQLTPQQAAQHPRSNLLYGGLGGRKYPTLSGQAFGPLQQGDILLACSDGLWHQIAEGEMISQLANQEPRPACEWMISQALERANGMSDNLSIVALKVHLDPGA